VQLIKVLYQKIQVQKYLEHQVDFSVCGAHAVIIDGAGNKYLIKMKKINVIMGYYGKFHSSIIEFLIISFRNIIVRPQWLRRIPGPPSHFRAQYRFYTANDSATSIDNYTPVLLFINKRSGGQSGEKIYRKLLHLLNPRQVFLLESDATILQALEIYSSLSNIRICVFGGDGTVGWILGCLAELYPSLNNPPVSICPLGTGNDLSRVLLWGEQYDPKRLLSILMQIPHAQSIALDRWQVSIEQVNIPRRESVASNRSFLSLINHPKFVRDRNRASYQNNRTLPNTRFINYMSFGLDAAIALEFHDRRKRDPTKFSSPLKNKLMYLNESRKYLNDFARSKMWNLSSYMRLICDGDDLTEAIRNCHTLVVLNIPGYASGTNPWGKSSNNSSTSSQTIIIQKDCDSFQEISTSSIEIIDLPANTHEVYELVTLNDSPNDQTNIPTITTITAPVGRFDRQDFGDKKIEVVGLSTTHMATIHMGFRGTRIAQCNNLRIEICCPMTAQMDGEPFYLPESVAVNITHAGQVLVLRNENR
jgi:diacylglycerol kinase family enzyme